MLLVVADADIVAGRTEGSPGDVEPAGAGEELVGMFTCLEERDEALELLRVTGTNVGSTALQVLGVSDTADLSVHGLAAEAGVDNDGADDEAGWLQELMAAVGDVHHILQRGDIVGVPVQMEEFAQVKMRR